MAEFYNLGMLGRAGQSPLLSQRAAVVRPMGQPIPATQPRSELQAAGINDLYSDYVKAQPAKRQTLTDYTAALLKTKPQTESSNASDQNYIGSVFSEGGAGSLQGALDRIARQRAASSNIAAAGATRSALRNYSLGRMMGGNSSYLDRAYGQNLAQIAAQNGQQLAGDQLQNQLTLTGARTGLLGRRQALTDQYLNSLITPYGTQNSLIRSDADTLGQLGGLEGANQQAAPYPNLRWSLR